MHYRIVSGILVLAALMLSGAAIAGGYRVGKVARDFSASPVKDCTRYNGTYGYYGNPWCTPAEQARWDTWSARRSRWR